jgi:tetratricopeptide (TPR) repeat protein
MNERTPVTGARRAFLCCIALGFAGMALVSVLQRLERPELIVPAGGRDMPAAGRDEAPADEIGGLMRKAAQDPGDADSMIRLAEHFMAEQNWEAAETFLRRAVTAVPAEPRPLYLLGITLHNGGKHAEAADCLERVVSLRDEPSVRYSLGVLYRHYLRDAARGAAHLRVALEQPGAGEELGKLIRDELASLPPEEKTREKTEPDRPEDPPAKAPSGGKGKAPQRQKR